MSGLPKTLLPFEESENILVDQNMNSPILNKNNNNNNSEQNNEQEYIQASKNRSSHWAGGVLLVRKKMKIFFGYIFFLKFFIKRDLLASVFWSQCSQLGQKRLQSIKETMASNKMATF